MQNIVQSTVDTLTIELESLKERIKRIEETCCSVNDMKQRGRTNGMLESLIKSVEQLVTKNDELEGMIRVLQKYFYIVMGVILAIEFFGADQILKKILTGG